MDASLYLLTQDGTTGEGSTTFSFGELERLFVRYIHFICYSLSCVLWVLYTCTSSLNISRTELITLHHTIFPILDNMSFPHSSTCGFHILPWWTWYIKTNISYLQTLSLALPSRYTAIEI